MTILNSCSTKGVNNIITLKEWVEMKEYLENFKQETGRTTMYIESALSVCTYIINRQTNKYESAPHQKVLEEGLNYLSVMYAGQERYRNTILAVWTELSNTN